MDDKKHTKDTPPILEEKVSRREAMKRMAKGLALAGSLGVTAIVTQGQGECGYVNMYYNYGDYYYNYGDYYYNYYDYYYNYGDYYYNYGDYYYNYGDYYYNYGDYYVNWW